MKKVLLTLVIGLVAVGAIATERFVHTAVRLTNVQTQDVTVVNDTWMMYSIKVALTGTNTFNWYVIPNGVSETNAVLTGVTFTNTYTVSFPGGVGFGESDTLRFVIGATNALLDYSYRKY